MRVLKIGIIGCGGRGKNTFRAHQPERNILITAGSDVDDKALNEFKIQFPEAVVFKDYHDLLAMREIDAVLISTPLPFHETMAWDALTAGKAVFMEKPMAATLEGCNRLCKLAEETGIKLFIGHNLRKFTFLSGLKERIDSGVIGEVKAIWCRHFVGRGNFSDDFFHRYSSPKYSHGLLLHKGSHDIDAIHWLGGAYTETVSGMGFASAFDKNGRVDPRQHSGLEFQEDHNMILMQLANRVQACYLQCHFAPDEERNYTVIGTLGRIENTGSNYGKTVFRVWSNVNGATEAYSEETPPPRKTVTEDADDLTLQNFLDYVRTDAVPFITPMDARYAVAVALAGSRSMREGNTPQTISRPM